MQDTNGNVPPITITGVSLPLLIVLGTMAGCFGGNAKSNDAGHKSQTRQIRFQYPKSPCTSLTHRSLAWSQISFSPSFFRFFSFRGFFSGIRFIYFIAPQHHFSASRPHHFSCSFKCWISGFGMLRESSESHAMDEIFPLCVQVCLTACSAPALLCCQPGFKVRL